MNEKIALALVDEIFELLKRVIVIKNRKILVALREADTQSKK